MAFKKYLIKTSGKIIGAGDINLEIKSISFEEDIASADELLSNTNKNLKLNMLEIESNKLIKGKDMLDVHPKYSANKILIGKATNKPNNIGKIRIKYLFSESIVFEIMNPNK